MTHAVETKHPLYIERADECPSCVTPPRREGGEGAATQYLPQPSGFSAQTDRGKGLYDAYQKRAQFPEIVHPTVHGIVGVIHRTEAQIEMPAAMQALWEKATKDGLPLEALHRRITAADHRPLCLAGRCRHGGVGSAMACGLHGRGFDQPG